MSSMTTESQGRQKLKKQSYMHLMTNVTVIIEFMAEVYCITKARIESISI